MRQFPKPPLGGFGVLNQPTRMRHICHIDESGDFGQLTSANQNAQPALVVVGLIVPEEKTAQMGEEFLNLRKANEFLHSRRIVLGQDEFPSEDKGNELRWALRSDKIDWRTGQPWRDGALSVLGLALDLLERVEARVAGCVHVKPINQAFSGKNAYVSSVLSIAANFHSILEFGHPEEPREQLQMEGRIICDDQRGGKSAVHQHFDRRKFRRPEFENSQKRAGLQLADWLCSAIIAPMAATTCFNRADLPESKHINDLYLSLNEGENSPWRRLTRMQFPFADDNGARQPGILVDPPELRGRLFPDSPRS